MACTNVYRGTIIIIWWTRKRFIGTVKRLLWIYSFFSLFLAISICRYSWVRNKHTRIRHTKHRSAAWGSFFRYHPVVVVYTCNILSYCLSTLTIDQLTSMLQTLFKDVFPTFRFRSLLIIVNRHVPMHVK